MMGLPGATVDSFRGDLQRSVDREVIAKIHPTQLLVNSPMNEPGYRQRHGIEATPGSLVTSAASYTRDDYEEMRKLRRVFLLLEKFGVLPARRALRPAGSAHPRDRLLRAPAARHASGAEPVAGHRLHARGGPRTHGAARALVAPPR